MFIRLEPDTLVRNESSLSPVGDGFYFNINRIGFARFRASTRADQAGLGADSSRIPEGTPCLEISIDGTHNRRGYVTLYFPGELEPEYRRLLTIVSERVI